MSDDATWEKSNNYDELSKLSKISDKRGVDNDSKSTPSTASVRAERHRRKKQNAKKAKAEVRVKEEEERLLLDKLYACSIKEK
ncbi:hypothetical protein ONS95_005944 [Cadophora gregata]|uniref:uncharacterized protein n=1 Tax=Cadophora gregata TaxID=51156 RepID=UPI0026DB444E|nr:uncharacterized protein ONS95_005944 [Cadophora gregata]KAK0102321.1 hypothetical protein ONS95_005944 [Cadophora gregata]